MNIKRVFDINLSLLGIFISFPLWLCIALAIFIQDSRAIFYVQDRVGKDGKVFRCFKFRFMIKDIDCEADFLQAYGENDMRYTRLGRVLRATAMDELPQLINILKGEMSFVGSRALRVSEQDVGDDKIRSVYEIAGFNERAKIVPGLTGIAQIYLPQ